MFDSLTMAAMADELTATLLDGRIQRIGLIDQLTFGAEVYAGGERRYLIASANNRQERLLLTASAPSFDPFAITPFGLLLRKYVRGGVIVGIEQPPLERLVRLSIAKHLPAHNAPGTGGRRHPGTTELPRDALDPLEIADEAAEFPGGSEEIQHRSIDVDEDGEAEATYVHIAVELMGRHSNLILIDDNGRIMESAKRVTSSMSRIRPVLPRLPYAPPPPQVEKSDPRRVTTEGVARLLAAEPTAKLADLLVRRLRGISPQSGRELAFRTGGGADVKVNALGDDAAQLLARETRSLFEPLLTSAWSARVYRNGDDVAAFSAVPMRHLAAAHMEEAHGSISAAAELGLMGEGAETPRNHAQRRAQLGASIREARRRLEGRQSSLRVEAAKADEIGQLRSNGEQIYAYLWQIEPGARELVVDGVRVPLDPSLSAKDNAQDYFERYRKAQSAGEHLPALIAKTDAELDYLDQLLVLTDQAEGYAAIEALSAEWQTRGSEVRARPGKHAKPVMAVKRARPVRETNEYAIYVGRSGRENDQVTFDLAGQDDTWLHARGVPGSHVVVRWRQTNGEEHPAAIVIAAGLAAYYSAARSSTTVDVDVTRRRYVRKIKGAGPGMVTYRNERTVAVRPRDIASIEVPGIR